MTFSTKLDHLHLWFRQNFWLWLFSIFTRLALAAGFLGAGIVKILGERFTDLHNKQPMGHYLEALFYTGDYYTSIGIFQVLAALLLLFPRTVLLGVLIYLPIILNICILSFSVRFEGSLFTSPMMVIANLYLLWWNYDRVKYLLPFSRKSFPELVHVSPKNKKFPLLFATGVLFTFIGVGFFVANVYEVKPRNTLPECLVQFEGGNRTEAGGMFCDCIHNNGQPLKACLEAYELAQDDPTAPAAKTIKVQGHEE